MGAVKHAVRVASDRGFEVPVRRQPPLVVGYEHFRAALGWLGSISSCPMEPPIRGERQNGAFCKKHLCPGVLGIENVQGVDRARKFV